MQSFDISFIISLDRLVNKQSRCCWFHMQWHCNDVEHIKIVWHVVTAICILRSSVDSRGTGDRRLPTSSPVTLGIRVLFMRGGGCCSIDRGLLAVGLGIATIPTAREPDQTRVSSQRESKNRHWELCRIKIAFKWCFNAVVLLTYITCTSNTAISYQFNSMVQLSIRYASNGLHMNVSYLTILWEMSDDLTTSYAKHQPPLSDWPRFWHHKR